MVFTLSAFSFGGFLILLLIILLNLRFFVHKSAAIDSVVLASPIALLVTILYIIAFNINIISLSIFVLVIIVLITNYRALQRFFVGLYVDYYRPVFRISSLLEAFLAVALLVAMIVYSPTNDTFSKGTQTKQTVLTGNSTYGLSPKTQVFSPTAAILKEYSLKENQESSNDIILYVPDLLCDSKDFVPVLKDFVDQGFTVFTCDVFLKDATYFDSILDSKILKSFSMRINYFFNRNNFNKNQEKYIISKSKEILAIKKYLEKEFPQKRIILLTDTFTTLSAKNLILPENMIKFDYGGLGLLSSTMPLEYQLFNKFNNQ